MNRYISDTHFGHENVIGFDGRPFENAAEMDQAMISIWNDSVSGEDDIWILGDFSYRSARPAEWYLGQLKGRLHLILGNHDRHLLKNPRALSFFESVDQATEVQEGDRRLVLMHYPILEWNGYFRGAWHLFGHIHNTQNRAYQVIRQEERMLNCAAVLTGYRPVALPELIGINRAYKEIQMEVE